MIVDIKNRACHYLSLRVKRSNPFGFSLLEMTVVLMMASILASAVIPQMINGYLIKAANKTALDISAIEEAARAYYVANNGWPASIAVLQAGNYLPASWNGTNPFGASSSGRANYNYSISSTSALLTVSTTIPTAAGPIIQNLVPMTTVNGNTIYSSVSLPGQSSVLPVGIIVAWSGPIASIPSGWALCNGVSVEKSDGSGMITPPDLRNQFIIGASQDNGPIAMTSVTGTLTQTGNGQIPSTTIVAQTVFGTNSLNSLKSAGFVYAPSLGNINVYTGLPYPEIVATIGSGSVNVAVYYALAFIMKI
ncbi:MAG: prepilin-type N-terminal cleavage/methylation domain-containing protein [Candidatus Omnitrophica bacterium]|nr:prepilin-type N-terminal cleavage/methylation domain-containing protein [Candidatus Omnitrophota bacterium]